jgi:hypothetical protein
MTKYLRGLQLEYLSLMAVFLYATYHFRHEIDWVHYIAFFAAIDLIGYIPGRIWSLSFKTEQPPGIFYWAYNACHNFVALASFSAAWWFFQGPEYGLLALFVHLCADRGMLGNFPKFRSDAFKTPTVDILSDVSRAA